MGNIVFTTKLDFVRNCKCYGFDAIALVDSQYDLIDLKLDINTVQVGSILVPSYDAINAYMDGNQEQFEAVYINQLMNRDCDEFISLIAYALFQNRNIVIYVGEEQTIVPYIDSLANYIRNAFGIIIGIDNEVGNIDLNYFSIWCSKFYLYGFINSEQFLSLYPPDKMIIPEVLNRLVIDNPPPEYFANNILTSVEACNQWYMQDIKQRKGLLKPLYVRNK